MARKSWYVSNVSAVCSSCKYTVASFHCNEIENIKLEKLQGGKPVQYYSGFEQYWKPKTLRSPALTWYAFMIHKAKTYFTLRFYGWLNSMHDPRTPVRYVRARSDIVAALG